MAAPIISVHNLGKCYRLGESLAHDTLRDHITDALGSLKRVFSGQSVVKNESDLFWALKDVSFDVTPGEIVGIIGRNGAGKSTLLKLLSQISEPTIGEIRLRGRMASLLEVGTGFHPELTGRENIFLNGAILGMRKHEIKKKFDEIVAFAEVEKFLDTPVKRYSSGMYVRLAFAVAAHLEPEILVVDEVLAVGDTAFQKKCLGQMGSLAKSGRTILFVSHDMGALRALCSKGVLLEKGSVQQIGGVQEVVENYLRQSRQSNETSSGLFPAFNRGQEIGITNCKVQVEDIKGQGLRLQISLKVKAAQKMRNIGVGISLTSPTGTLVSWLGPFVTNYVIEEINDECECVFSCDGVDQYLAGGDYDLNVWLSRPRVEYLLRVERAAIVSIPGRDLFSAGVEFVERKFGPVPLPVRFQISKL